MGKKKTRKVLSSAENPFNLRINRTKHTILGQNVKGTRGLPGVSHAAGNARRKELFHQKKVQLQKANKYLDKRLLNSNQTYEDPATARLIQERKKKLKKNIFNLNDDESLTHKGMPLLDNLSKDIVGSDDEEAIDPQFIKQAHFGSFSGDSASKSRKEIIDEMILESKKRKYERKIAKETNANLIEKLDKEWKERHTTLPPKNSEKNLDLGTKTENTAVRKVGKSKDFSNKNDPFDVFLQELKFEKKSTPATRIKTPEEIAKEEYEKQKLLEEERNKRMNPVNTNNSVINHISADSIYDGLDIQLDILDDQDCEEKSKTVNEFTTHDSDDDSLDDESENEFNVEAEDHESDSNVTDGSEIPDTLEIFSNIANSNDNLHLLVDNILKPVMKNKTKKNIEKLENFFVILIEYVLKNKIKQTKALFTLDQILPHLYTLAELSPINTTQKLLTLIDNEFEHFQISKDKKLRKNFPQLKCLVLFKISSTLYSVSDFRHPVVTPAITFMCDVLSSAFTGSVQNIISRLFICKYLYDSVSYSRRYVPEVIFFLDKVLELGINKTKVFNLVPNMCAQQKFEINLDICNKPCSDAIKLSILSETLKILHDYAKLYSNLLSFREIFSVSIKICNQFPSSYPDFLTKAKLQFSTYVENIQKSYMPLTYENKKPVPLKWFEPAFDSKFTRNKDDIKKKNKLVKNVQQKIKKEERSVLREMRRETQVIASEKLKEIIEGDDERKRKVKQLYSELAMQEGEFKKYMKKK